jgi:hypothetical protein
MPDAAQSPCAPEARVTTSDVAVIAIHGVADQTAGQTARDIATLLVSSHVGCARYSEGTCDTLIHAVKVLEPIVECRSPEDDHLRITSVNEQNGSFTKRLVPGEKIGAVEKSLRQSFRSDFQQDDWITAARQAPQDARAAALPGTGGESGTEQRALMKADRGVAFTDYLLFKAKRNGSPDESYESARVRLTRRDDNTHAENQVHVHEMYWADLSRLSSGVPRIVTEVFTMVFRLARLGRDTVAEAARAATVNGTDARAVRRLARVSALQSGLDWAFSMILANLFAQLLLAGLLITAAGLALGHEPFVRGALVGAAVATFAWLTLYRTEQGWSSFFIVATGALVIGFGGFALPADWVIGLVCLGGLALLCGLGLRIAEARFPGTRHVGLLFLALSGTAVLGHALAAPGRVSLHSWMGAGMTLVEYILVLVVAWWAVMGAVMVIWFLLGQRAIRATPALQASIATGRLGMFASLACFVVLTMAVWALMTTVVEIAAKQTSYVPVLFPLDASPPADEATLSTGTRFLRERYRHSTETFALAAGLTLALGVYLVLMLLPSVLAEIKTRVGTAKDLGRWLSGGYRRLDGFVTALVALSVLVALGVGFLLLSIRFGVQPGGWVEDGSGAIGRVSREVLKPLVLGAATIGAALTAFGGLLSKYVPWVRSPLDVALDVDNHFREFPRSAIPRARIFSRYVSLLEHVADKPYEKILIVAHSQGTVITAELLRYLKFRGERQGPQADRLAKLWAKLDGRLVLLTAGCPLRQLYAARFPELYEWVSKGAKASEVGVQRCINVYTAGDYVGRWLWRDEVTFDAATTPPEPTGTEAELCLGFGAHTHYFEREPAHVVARLIDSLIRVGPNAPPDVALGASTKM